MSSEFDREIDTSRKLESVECDGALQRGSWDCRTDNDTEPTEEERLVDQVFSNPLVLKQLLTCLDIKDLLRTSLVNKNWNFFSREILRENKNCLANVQHTNLCHSLKKLNDLLLNSDTVPFKGISIGVAWGFNPNHECVIQADVSELVGNILRKIDIKYLDLRYNFRGIYSHCIALEAMREIIAEKASSLEDLRVIKFPSSKSFSEFISRDLQGQWLPSVQALEFSVYAYRNQPLMIKELVEASPKLQKQSVCGGIYISDLEFILPWKVGKTVKDFTFRPKINYLGNCVAFALQNPQLEELSFSTIHDYDGAGEDDGPPFSVWSESHQNDVSRIVKQLLESSQDSLKTLTCDYLDLILMTSKWNIPNMNKVNHLKLFYDNYMDFVAEGCWALRKLEWAKYFPNLKEVNVDDREFQDLDRDFYIDKNLAKSKFVCASVKILRWRESSVGAFQMFKVIFPNLTELHLKHCPGHKFPKFLNELWTGWPDLELVYAFVILEEWIPNCDSAFLGISKEEAAFLLENIDELESLEIVPTRPSIFNLRKLKTFDIRPFHHAYFCSQTRSNSSTVVSRLAGQCGFSRVPGLHMKIHPLLCEHLHENPLDHPKPSERVVEQTFSGFGCKCRIS